MAKQHVTWLLFFISFLHKFFEDVMFMGEVNLQ